MKHMWPKTKQRLKLQRRWLKLKGKLLMLLSNKSTVKLFRAMLLSNNSTVKLCRALLFWARRSISKTYPKSKDSHLHSQFINWLHSSKQLKSSDRQSKM